LEIRPIQQQCHWRGWRWMGVIPF